MPTLREKIRIEYPNELDNSFSYNSLNNLSFVGVENAKGDSVYSMNYTYDNLYQLTSEKKLNQAETSRLYEYQYTFDDAGNRTKMKYFDGSITQTIIYEYNDLNQLCYSSRIEGYDYHYDNNGNLTRESLDEKDVTQRLFTWKNDNRLTSVDNVVDSKEVEYTYDPMGRRIMRKDVDINTYTYYYYDGLTVMAEKKKVGAGNPTWDRIFTDGPGALGNIFRISTWNGNSWDDSYYHYDAIGNVVMKSTSSAGPFTDFEQEAYGNVKVGS